MSEFEYLLETKIKESGLPKPERRWKFDLAWLLQKVAVEVDGGIFSRGRHVRGVGFEKDAEKRNAAVMAGWRVLHFTPRHIKSSTAVREIETLLKATP